jgi:hypothetical protein
MHLYSPFVIFEEKRRIPSCRVTIGGLPAQDSPHLTLWMVPIIFGFAYHEFKKEAHNELQPKFSIIFWFITTQIYILNRPFAKLLKC